MTRIRLYLDEDAMQHGLVTALRARRVDILTASDAGMINKGDGDHLRWAARNQRALYSFNMADYTWLHRQWLARGEPHSGIILASQQRYSVGEQLRRLLRLLSRTTAEEMQHRLEYLSVWGA
jgi:hypothetical protein